MKLDLLRATSSLAELKQVPGLSYHDTIAGQPDTVIRAQVRDEELRKPIVELDLEIDKTKGKPYGDETKVREYIKRYENVAVQEMDKFGIPASIALAQGIKESKYGTGKLARTINNHFGIKCFSRRCNPGHCTNHTDDSHKDFFVVYKSAWYSWRDHSKHLSNSRYKSMVKYGKDYKKWAWALQSRGYATDPGYAASLISIIERYRLYRFDEL
jgi:flagellum-specific peptidoglycan hydrolase FlgJ